MDKFIHAQVRLQNAAFKKKNEVLSGDINCKWMKESVFIKFWQIMDHLTKRFLRTISFNVLNVL